MADEAAKFKIIDNPSVAESYANKLIATFFDGGSVVITLGATRFVPEHSGEPPKEGSLPSVHVTARLAVSPTGAVELANALNSMLNMLRQNQPKAAVGDKPN
jgi:hypothetical protein